MGGAMFSLGCSLEKLYFCFGDNLNRQNKILFGGVQYSRNGT